MGKSKKVASKAKTENHEVDPPAEQAPAPAEPVVTTRKAKKETAPTVPRVEQNGIRRPGPGKCLEVWE
jgi:hypothetical protein